MANETTEESREYDKDERLLATTNKFTGRIAYRYDLLGNRISMLDPDKGEFAYAYFSDQFPGRKEEKGFEDRNRDWK